MDKPKKLILDYSKWICGAGGPHQVGKGKVALRNPEGFYCCLGLWSLQCGANDDELLEKGEPCEIETLIPLFAEEDVYTGEEYNPTTDEYVKFTETCGKINTTLALSAIGINDETKTTPEEKIHALTKLLAEEGIELEVINKPE
jgi:hypothetical protein